MARPVINLVGQRFGRLVVVSLKLPRKPGNAIWICICDCGITKEANSGELRSKRIMSCGCLQAESCGDRFRTHGESSPETVEYRAYRSMICRCLDKNFHAYDQYGGRGITICDRWLESYDNFLIDVGRRPVKTYSIDRIDGNGPYCPENVRWASKQGQSANRKLRKKNSQSRFKGVFVSGKRWRARIHVNGQQIDLGTYADDVDAATAYNFGAYKYFGEYASFNTPYREVD